MKIALTDMDIVWEDKETNKSRCIPMIREAAERGAELILFPEMTLTGFSMNVEKICDKENETISFFSEQAKTYQIAVGFGYVTKNENGRGQNHFCMADRFGNVIADYIKIHPFTYGGEKQYYEGGREIVSCSFGDAKCGLFVCYDLRFAEAFWQLPVDTDMIFIIANWPASRIHQWYALLKARAIEMQSYILGVNRVGTGDGLLYEKSSVAFAPDGTLVSVEEGERNRYVSLDLAARRDYVKEFPVRPDRRPDIYRA
jgi:predicted amidohydrolase